MKYYHASRKHWKVGDIITAQHGRWYSKHPGIYVSTAPEPHFTLMYVQENRIGPGMRLYRVVPLGKVKKGKYKDLICKVGVQVVESLGEIPMGKVSEVSKSGKPIINKVGYRDEKTMGLGLGRVVHKPGYVVNKYVNGVKTIVRGFRDLKKAEAFVEKLDEEESGGPGLNPRRSYRYRHEGRIKYYSYHIEIIDRSREIDEKYFSYSLFPMLNIPMIRPIPKKTTYDDTNEVSDVADF